MDDIHNRPTGAHAARVTASARLAIRSALVVRESAVGLEERGDRVFVALYTANADGSEPHAVLFGLAGAAALVEDVTTLLNSSPAIAALVREVLSERRRDEPVVPPRDPTRCAICGGAHHG